MILQRIVNAIEEEQMCRPSPRIHGDYGEADLQIDNLSIGLLQYLVL